MVSINISKEFQHFQNIIKQGKSCMMGNLTSGKLRLANEAFARIEKERSLRLGKLQLRKDVSDNLLLAASLPDRGQGEYKWLERLKRFAGWNEMSI